MDELFPAIVILAFIAFGVLLIVWTFSRSRSVLDEWARANGFRILSSKFRWVRKGPFFWTSSKGQMVYYVTVMNSDGTRRSGYVRCGGFFLGLLTDKVEVRWD
jgi:hypothetical protein